MTATDDRYREWARFVRQAMGWASITEDDELVTTPFREQFRMPPRTESQLRQMARDQVTESRGGGYRK